MKKILLSLLISTILIGCGGSNESSTDSELKTGVLTDSPIQGATYTINGVDAITNEKGEFQYKDGDVITFKIGNIAIGTAKGAARITPVDLTDDPIKQINLLIFLQSLDAEGDHDDGIQIPNAVNLITVNSVDFAIPTTQFINNLENQLKNIPELTNLTVVTEEKAKENFAKTLMKDYAGIWYAQAASNDPEDSELFLIIREDGTYMFGEAVLGDSTSEGNGIEVGIIQLDPLTGEFYAYATIDTNGDWGLHDPEARKMKISFTGNQLKIEEADNPEENGVFSRISNVSNNIVGAWQADVGKQLFVFNDNNTYFLLDPIGDDQVESGDQSCGGPGIEFGTYRVQNNRLFVDIPKIDTNGCAGLSDTDASLGLPITINGNTLTFTVANEGTYTLTRP